MDNRDRVAVAVSVGEVAQTWRLRGYAVEQVLGRGATADVWRARVAASGEPVALKRIPVPDDARRERAEAEAALLGALDHPNLVRLLALERLDDTLVLVLDLADGGSLRDLLSARGRLTAGEVITTVTPVAAALAYLHDEGVVHGDVSAANVLFTPAGVPMLADVGTARISGDDRDAESTPAYADPVVAAGGLPGPAGDVFMLAAVAFHALTGEPLWPGDAAPDVLGAAAAGRTGDLGARLTVAGVAPAMTRVLRRALDLDPDRRGTAADLALDLRHSGVPTAVELGAGASRPVPQPLPRPDPAGPPTDAAAGALSGRHAAPEAGAARPDPGRPSFDRPGPAVPPGAEPPTHALRARPRPELPRRVTRRRWARLPSAATGRSARWVLVTATLLGLVGVAGWLWWPSPASRPAARAAVPPAVASPSVPSSVPEPSSASPFSASSSSPSSTASSSVATSAAIAPAGAADLLADLDAVRARAYAARDVGLLSAVYAPGPLLAADRAELTRLVPAGCGLVGALTTYRVQHATPRGTGLAITVWASLPSTRVVCPGRVGPGSAPVAPRRLAVDLDRTSAGYRIAGQRPA